MELCWLRFFLVFILNISLNPKPFASGIIGILQASSTNHPGVLRIVVLCPQPGWPSEEEAAEAHFRALRRRRTSPRCCFVLRFRVWGSGLLHLGGVGFPVASGDSLLRQKFRV